MDIFFRDRTAKVLVVDPSGASRTLLTEVIRGLGFGDVLGVPSLKDAIGVVEVEPVKWLVSSFFSDQPENLMQILKLVCTLPELKQMRVTALVEESEFDLLPHAFERGLLSYHRKPFTKDSLSSDLKDLCSRYEAFAWQSAPLAGSFLRQALMQLNEFQELLNFERQLLKASPGDLQQLLNLVPALAKTDHLDEAKSILTQVTKIDSKFDAQVKVLADTYLSGVSLDTTGTGFNVLGIKSVMILDSDSTVQNEIKAAMTEMGVESIQIFDDGMAALESIKTGQIPDLILLEWRIPKLTGPLFLQKAQEEGARSCPFILISSLVQKEDIPFVREMGVANVLAKPLQRQDLIRGVTWTIQQDRKPTEQSTMERKMRQMLEERKFDEAASIKMRFTADMSINQGSKELIEAEFAYAQGQFEKARDCGIEAIKHGGESIFVLNLLGKTMINLRDFATALKCFQKAQSLAPMNIERLCQIAEIHSELGEDNKAKDLLEEIKDLDPDSQRAQESEAKMAISKGDINSAKQIMGQLRALENVVSYMNNQAVAMARCGMINEGLEQYAKTLQAIPEERQDIKAIIEYNIALACLRSNKLHEAKEHLTLSTGISQSKVTTKAQNLLKRVNQAIDKGVQLQMAKTLPLQPGETSGGGSDAGQGSAASEGKETAENVQELSSSRVLAVVSNHPGEVACYMIYTSSLQNARLKKMLDNTVRFNPRKAIERQESMGADRLLASS